VDRLHLSAIVAAQGGDHQLQEHSGAGMAQPQESRHGTAAARPLHVRLAEAVLEGRRIGHRAARSVAEEGAMPMPPPAVQTRSLHGRAEALPEEGKDV
jgi:hypothetical protein